MEWEYEVIGATPYMHGDSQEKRLLIGVMCHDKPIIAFNYISKVLESDLQYSKYSAT